MLISKTLNFREKVLVSFLVLAFAASFFSWIFYIYYNATKPVPKKGGEYIEGIVGQPHYINPLLSQTSEADSSLVQLIYSSLLKYDAQGKITNDLAESYEISEDQRTYTFHLKKDLLWHDGAPFTATDVYFTLNALQDPAYKSPLRQNFQGIEISQLDDFTIQLGLKNPYFGFLNNLTVGIIPKHIWENISPEKFALADYNLQPIGSGPYKIVDFQKDSNGNIRLYNLHSFEKYYAGEPFITRLTFNFYPDEDTEIADYNKKEIKGMENILPEKISSLKNQKSTGIHSLFIPSYFAVFFNQTKSVLLADDKIRQALAYSVNRQEIIDQVLDGKGEAIFYPFLPQMKEFDDSIEKHNFDIEKANKILEDEKWKMNDEGIREKDGVKLEFEMFTIDWPELTQTADLLANQWRKIGVLMKPNVVSVADLRQNYIRPREYEALLFGQITSFTPDPYSFWHSSQTKDPGLNLSLFNNQKADDLLLKAREEMNEDERVKQYQEFQKIVAQDVPAVFLYSSFYLYPVSTEVKGITAQNINSYSWRFADVNKWYIKTARVKNNQ